MKTNLLHKSSLCLCAIMLVASNSAPAVSMTTPSVLTHDLPLTLRSTYVGPVGGNWSNPANWSPPFVPNSYRSILGFNVSVGREFPGVTLDINALVHSLTLTGNQSTVYLLNHSLTSAATSVGVNFPNQLFGGGFLFLAAEKRDVLARLGNLADFSGTTLNTGNYVIVASTTNPELTATVQFNDADIRTNRADIQLAGPGSRIIDQTGNDALSHFNYNQGASSIFDIEAGRNLTTEGSLVNEGEVHVLAGFGGDEATTTLTINGDYTGIGSPFDPGTNGVAFLVAPGPLGDARMVIRGHLTNYDGNTHTLRKSYWWWEAANGRKAVTQVLGGPVAMDIVPSRAALILIGPLPVFGTGMDATRSVTWP